MRGTGVLKGAMNKTPTPVSQQGSSSFTNSGGIINNASGLKTPPPEDQKKKESKSFFSNNPLVQSAMLTAGASAIPAMLSDDAQDQKDVYAWKKEYDRKFEEENEEGGVEVPDFSKMDGVVKVAGADSQYGATPRRGIPYWQKLYSADPNNIFAMKPYGSA
jgi:hypothetical protein